MRVSDPFGRSEPVLVSLSLLIALLCGCAADEPSPGGESDLSPGASDLGPLDEGAADLELESDSGQRPDLKPEEDLSPDLGPEPDPTEAAFDPDHLLQVDIRLAEEDWDQLRSQVRPITDVYRPDCMDAPLPSVYTWFTAEVTVDGQTFHRVAIRKKGLYGSHSRTKPSLKLRFDKFVDGQRFSGLKRVTLNNAIQRDRSYVPQCMTYTLFRSLGLPAPRCNFAQVRLNGRDMGVYVHVEAIKKDFLRRWFEDEDGALYEGALSDFRPEWLGTFTKKTREDEPGRPELQAIVDAMAQPDERLLPALEQVLDLQHFYRFWVLEVLAGHWDGYATNANNYYVYSEPGRPLVFIPWGTDATFLSTKGPRYERMAPYESLYAHSALVRRLYLHPEGRRRYWEVFHEVLERVWDEERLLAEVDRMEALFRPALLPEEAEASQQDVERIRSFVRSRVPDLERELRRGEPEWRIELVEPPCGVEVGELDLRLQATWGSYPCTVPESYGQGGGSGSVDLDGEALTFSQIWGASGLEPGPREMAVLVAPLVREEAEDLLLYVVVDPELAVQGSPLEVNGLETYASLNRFTDQREVLPEAMLYQARILIHVLPQAEGDLLDLSVSGRLLRLPAR